ncbi:MAG: SDR family oxidoreductase [Gemmatimonadota bacterium]
MNTTLITGAGRGIGLELARQAAERGDRVIATTRKSSDAIAALADRHGDRIIPLMLDAGDERSIVASRAALPTSVDSIELLINNAGMYPARSGSWNPAATGLDGLTMAELTDVFRVNAAGPVLIARHYLDLLEAGRARVLNVSSLVGSVASKTEGGDYAYAASKAALNIMTRALAADLSPRGIVVVAITPGWVRTDMGGSGAALSPERSVRGILAVARRLTAADAGRFVDYQGALQPW